MSVHAEFGRAALARGIARRARRHGHGGPRARRATILAHGSDAAKASSETRFAVPNCVGDAVAPFELFWGEGSDDYVPAANLLRGRRLGVVFRHHVPLLGRFIADFLAPAQRLVIEVDGAYHGERGRADARRDAALERAGYRIVRLEASLILGDIELALSVIRAAIS